MTNQFNSTALTLSTTQGPEPEININCFHIEIDRQYTLSMNGKICNIYVFLN